MNELEKKNEEEKEHFRSLRQDDSQALYITHFFFFAFPSRRFSFKDFVWVLHALKDVG